MHKCESCLYLGEHQEMGFCPTPICTKAISLEYAVKAYKAPECPYKVKTAVEQAVEDIRPMKKPDEIKKALECCFYDSAQCGDCPYYPVNCDRELVRDAREYIRQLEAERDALLEYLTNSHWLACSICKHDTEGGVMGCKHMRENGIPCFEWRGVQKEE